MKDVRMPFIVFKGEVAYQHQICLKIFTIFVCFIRRKCIYLHSRIMFRENHKLLPKPKTTGYQCNMLITCPNAVIEYTTQE